MPPPRCRGWWHEGALLGAHHHASVGLELDELVYLRFHPIRSGSRVEVHQLADDRRQAAFLTQAWSMVLGRFAAAHADGVEPVPARRARRPKRRA